MNDHRGSGDIDTLRIGPYLTAYGERWFLDTWISCGFSDNDVRRTVQLPNETLTAQANYLAADATAYLGGGAQYDVGDSIVMPLASLQYYYYPNSGYLGGVVRFSGSQRSNVFLRYTGSLAGPTHFHVVDLGLAIGF
ncbi:MAG: autotransporter outer membrane beta-barrel domain-containing protein [Pirellulaceae bacterium]